MSHPLPYASPAVRAPSRSLAFFANLSAAYPLAVVLCLYGQWLLSGYMLGHAPQPSVDDPKDIIGARWMHPFTGLALLGLLPAAATAVALNVLHVVHHRIGGRSLAARIVVMFAFWGGALALLRSDPGSVVVWWLD